jgi:hypothetical protein
MATGSLYGSSSESTGLYGIGAASGGTYFEWFIFQDSATAPATPTGGSWSFTNNTGTAPSGWVVSPPPAPVNQVWVSIAVVDSRNATTLTWSVPGLMTGSGLPILTGAGVPSSGTGLNGQLYINTSTTPQSMYNKQAGAWVQLTGSNLVDLVNNQTIGGVKTFSETIQGSISGTAGNVSGVVAVANGGTNATTASGARTSLGLGTISTQAASSVAITGGSITGITDLAIDDGGTGASTASQARINLGAVGLADTQTLTNKSISGSANTLTNIPNSALANDSVNVNGVDLTLGAVQLLGADWILPSYAGNAGKVLALNPSASDVQWVPAAGVGTVTSVDVSGGTTGLTASGGPVTAAGTITLGGTLSLLNGGTGQTTANAAFNALVPLQTGNSGKYLTTNGTDTSWAANPLGTVTSVSGTGTVSGLTLTGTVTTSGNLTLGGTLNLSAPPAIGGTTPNTGVFTNLTVNDNTILGSSNSDTVSFNARVNSGIDPSTDNAYDLGRNAHAWRNLYLTGTANIAALAASGAVTLSGGTANGVAYLNDSKVLTTGSALTFSNPSTFVTRLNVNSLVGTAAYRGGVEVEEGSSSFRLYGPSDYKILETDGFSTPSNIKFYVSNTEQMRLTSTGLGIGTSSPSSKLTVYGGEVQWGASSSLGFLGYTGGYPLIGSLGALPLAFYTNGNERMRLDSSGNLGIGTSSPNGTLTINKPNLTNGTVFLNGATTNADFMRLKNTGADGLLGIAGVLGTEILSGGSAYATQLFTITATSLQLGTNGIARATLDSSGNLGLGVTPSAWNGAFKAIEFGAGSAASFSNEFDISQNAFFGASNWQYKTTSTASLYQQNTGQHRWFTAASGTAGDVISFSQAMTLTDAGDLQVGFTGSSITAGGIASVPNSATSYRAVGHITGSASGSAYDYFLYAGSIIGSITQSGTSAVLYNVTSDQRLKENIQDAAPASALIDALQVREYDWKADGSHQRYGFIAQELVTVAPEAVHQPADPEAMMAVDYSKLVPMLVKEIQSLRQRLAAAGI